MNWNRVSIETSDLAADLVSLILMDAGAAGVEISGGSVPDMQPDEYLSPLHIPDKVVVKAYYGQDDFDRILGYIKGRIESAKYTAEMALGSLFISVNEVEDTDWNENFKKHFRAFRAAGNIVVKPTWESFDARDDDVVIEMDPGMAFGSGVHETTKMCLALAQKYMRFGADALDVGCGSGILGIACAKMGAKSVLALDNDSISVRVTKDNALQNGVENLEARQSDLLKNADNAQFDIVLANIVADIVIRLNADVARYMKQDAVYIISGIIEERLRDVLRSLKKKGLKVIETMEMADWRALAVRRADA